MRYTRPLDDILGQKSKVRILRHLSGIKAETSGRRIAADVHMSPTVVHRALADLVEQGVVMMRTVGNVHLFGLDRGNFLVETVLLPLFRQEAGLTEAAVSEVVRMAGEGVISVVLFGSVAVGREVPRSDIDFLIIAADSAAAKRLDAALLDGAPEFIGRFGNAPSPYVVTKREFICRYRRGDPLIREAVRTGRVVHGDSIAEVLAGGAAFA